MLAIATNTVEKRRASLLAALAHNTEQPCEGTRYYNDLKNCALLNAALGNKEEAIRLAKRTVELYPVSQDALVGPGQLNTLAKVYAWTGEKDLAFETLFTLVKVPRGLAYGELKLNPAWDNLRDDPRFGDLLGSGRKATLNLHPSLILHVRSQRMVRIHKPGLGRLHARRQRCVYDHELECNADCACLFYQTGQSLVAYSRNQLSFAGRQK